MTAPHALPTGSLAPLGGLLVERFPDRSGFAFNVDRPSGVKYLTRRGIDSLLKLCGRHGAPPRIPEHELTPETRRFVEHGLATTEVDTTTSSTNGKKCTRRF